MPNAELYDACYQYLEASYEVLDSRTAGFERVDALFKELRPSSPVHYQMRGVFYVDYAWEARGDNYAKTVTAEARKLMQERLKLAERALKKAWELDPKDPQPAAEMIQVAMGQRQGRQSMEMWFNRAIEADPDNYDACKKKLYYLDPNWYGSADILLHFGRACLQAKNWESGLPFVLVEAHERLAGLRNGSRLYYDTPDVWKDIHEVYGTYLEKYPDARRRRTQYARLAALCGQWKVADEQFNLLGDRAFVDVFRTRDEYEELRRKAAERAAVAKS